MCLQDIVIMNSLVILITICGFLCEVTETHGQQCRRYSKKNVRCSELTLINGRVCYDWFLETGNGSAWSWSSLRCLSGYTFGILRNVLYCNKECNSTEFVICGYEWDGSPPVCQPIDTTVSTPSSADTTSKTTISTIWTRAPVAATTTMQTNTASVTTTTTMQTKTAPVATTTTMQTKTAPVATTTTMQTKTASVATTTTMQTKTADEGQNLPAVYVTVPLVVFFSLTTLVLAVVICRRKCTKGNSKVPNNQKMTVRDADANLESKNEANDPYVNLVTVVEEPQVENNAYACIDITRQKLQRDTLSSPRDISLNNLKGHDVGNRAEDENEYDHLGSEAHAVADSTYTHTSRQGDLDMYSHTQSTAQSGVPKTVSDNINTALKDTEQTYDAINQCATSEHSHINNKSDQKGRRSANVSEDNNLYTVVQKISKRP